MARKRRASSKALERRVSEKSEELRKRGGRTADKDVAALATSNAAKKQEKDATEPEAVDAKATESVTASSTEPEHPSTKAKDATDAATETSQQALHDHDEHIDTSDGGKDSADAIAKEDATTADGQAPAEDVTSDTSDAATSPASSSTSSDEETPATVTVVPGSTIPDGGESADDDSSEESDAKVDAHEADSSHAKADAKVRDIKASLDEGISEAMGKIEASIDAITDNAADAPDIEDEAPSHANKNIDTSNPSEDDAKEETHDEGTSDTIPEFLRRHTVKDGVPTKTDGTSGDASKKAEKHPDASDVSEGDDKDHTQTDAKSADRETEDTSLSDSKDTSDVADTSDDMPTDAEEHADTRHDASADASNKTSEQSETEEHDEHTEKLGKVAAETVATAAGAAASAVGDALHDAASATADKTRNMAKATSSALANLRDRVRKASEERHRKVEERRKEKEEERRLQEEERERAAREAPARESQTKGAEDELHEAGVDATIREVSEQNDLGSFPPVRVYIPEEDEPMPRPIPHHERFSVILPDGGMVPARPLTERELSRRVSAWAGTRERYASRRFVGVALVVVLGLGLLVGAGTSLYTAHAIEEAAQRATRTINWSGGDGASYAPDANKVSDDQSGKAYKMGSEASVAVIATDSSGKAVGHWSGTIVDGSGHVVVPYAVTSYANGGAVRCYTADGKGYTADVTGTDAQGGLATLTIGYSTKPDAALADSSTTRVGQWAMVVSRESGTSAQAAAGIVSSIDSTSDVKDASGASIPLTLIRTDIPANDVLAGAPVMDSDGNVIGIAVSTAESVVYAIPSNYVATSAKSMLSSGSMEHASLGASMETNGGGLTITDAGTSGLTNGDTLVSVAGTAVSSEADVTRVLMANKPGDTVPVTVRNARGANETVNVELSKANGASAIG